MGVEIRELVIKGEVRGLRNDQGPRPRTPQELAQEKQQMMDDLVAQVLEILRYQKEP